MKYIFALGIIVLLAGAGWYSLSQKTAPLPDETGNTYTTGTDAPNGDGVMETGTIPDDTASSTATTTDIAVSAFNFGFTPSVISVKKGDHVRILLSDAGGKHDFVIDEFNVRTPRIETGATTTVEFDATKAGTFQYYSSFSNDRASGMWGNLIVAE